MRAIGRRRPRRLATALGGLLLLSACSEAAGLEAEQDNSSLRSCLERTGAPGLDGVEDWSAEDERRFLSDPDALGCVVDEVGPGDSLEDSMTRAFEDAPEDEVLEVLTGFVGSRDADPETQARDVGVLLGALDDDGDDFGLGERARLAFAIHRDAQGSATYDEWRAEHDREDDGDSVVDFYQEQENQGTALYRELDALQQRIAEAQLS